MIVNYFLQLIIFCLDHLICFSCVKMFLIYQINQICLLDIIIISHFKNISNFIRNTKHHNKFLINKRTLLNTHKHIHLIVFNFKSNQINLNISQPIIKHHLFHKLIDFLLITLLFQKQNINNFLTIFKLLNHQSYELPLVILRSFFLN